MSKKAADQQNNATYEWHYLPEDTPKTPGFYLVAYDNYPMYRYQVAYLINGEGWGGCNPVAWAEIREPKGESDER